MMMKYYRILLLLFAWVFIVTSQSCNNDGNGGNSKLGNWVKTTPFKGSRRSGAIMFTIGSRAFVGLGYDGKDYTTNLYEYNADLGFWQTKAPFIGVPRERAVAFSINGKGYIGLGYNRDKHTEALKDFWEYDPATDTWKQLNDFGGSARYNAVAFSISNKGYVGTGNDGSNYNGDFWEYDPSTDSWQEIASYPGEKREEATSFVIDDKAYLCTGRNNGLTDIDFWEFNPEGKIWTNRRPDDSKSYYDDFTLAARRYGAVSFVVDGKAYIATGLNSSGAADNKVFEYDPLTEVWDEKTSFEGSARSQAIAFVLNNKSYLGTGQNSSTRFDDIWEFRPTEKFDKTD